MTRKYTEASMAQKLSYMRKYNPKYRLENAEKVKEINRLYYINNKERLKAKSHKYYIENREKIREQDRERRLNNPNKKRANWLKCKYGISFEYYQSMLLKQQFKCAACGNNLQDLPSKQIHVDHCHDRNHIRGVLCQPCNMALGIMKENAMRLQGLANYAKFDNRISMPSLYTAGDYCGTSV